MASKKHGLALASAWNIHDPVLGLEKALALASKTHGFVRFSFDLGYEHHELVFCLEKGRFGFDIELP